MSVQTTTTAWIPDDGELGARLALVRHRMGWNQKEAALACGFAQNSWRGWEEGVKPRDLSTVAAQIAARTGVDLMWLTFGSMQKAPRPAGEPIGEPPAPVPARPKGLEPPTFWLVAGRGETAGHDVVVDLAERRRRRFLGRPAVSDSIGAAR